MTETSSADPAAESRPDQARVNTEHLRDYTQLRRSTTDRKVAGVAGGLGRHLNLDPTILRVAFVVLVFFGGAGLLLYGAAWLLVPEDGRDRAHLSTQPGTRNALLLVAAVLAALLLLGDSWGGFGPPWPIALIALIVVVVLLNRDKPMTTPSTDTETLQGTDPAPAPTSAPQAPPPWMPATSQGYQPPPPAPDRGPKLFWVTLALVAIALGGLGLYDTLGGAVTGSAYPALALTVVGGMLVLGAWVGRAGGLVALGVVASLTLAATSAAVPRFEAGPDRIDAAPESAGSVQERYYVPAGEIRLDLSRVEDVEALDGRRIELEANAGEIEVIVPEGVAVDAVANVDAAGEADILGQGDEGINVSIDHQVDASSDAPELELDMRLLFGRIDVDPAPAATSSPNTSIGE